MSYPHAHRPQATYSASTSTPLSTFHFESSSSTVSQPAIEQFSRAANNAHSFTFPVPAVNERHGESHDQYSAAQTSQATSYTRSVPLMSRQNDVCTTPPRGQQSLYVPDSGSGPSPAPSHRRRSPPSFPSVPRDILARYDDNLAGFVDSISNQANFGGEFRNNCTALSRCECVSDLSFVAI